ncbi:hypothetical protein GF327_03630 [Candidatus Woesearchaeota archaeon]|nr:hypothetical protein [Candidatus Woesearchaeota archaeon]
MGDNSILWKDKQMSLFNLFVIISTLFLLMLTPLIPLAFKSFEEVKLFIALFYVINGIIFLFIGLNLYYEYEKWLYFTENGIVLKWNPETGEEYLAFGWHQLKRINMLNSWSPKSYMRWKRIKNELSGNLFIASALYENMLILETKMDEIFFVGVNDSNGFFKNLKKAKNVNPYLSNLPVMNFGIKW